MSLACSRRSMTRVCTACPRRSASSATRCAARSASSLVEDGSDVPALTTTRLNVSLIACSLFIFIIHRSLLAAGGGCVQLRAQLLEAAQFRRGQARQHGLGDRAAVPAA